MPLATFTLLMESSSVDVLVIGAGPTGLGAAKRLHQLVIAYITTALVARLIRIIGWAVMDDYRLERDSGWIGFHRHYARRIRLSSYLQFAGVALAER